MQRHDDCAFQTAFQKKLDKEFAPSKKLGDLFDALAKMT